MFRLWLEIQVPGGETVQQRVQFLQGEELLSALETQAHTSRVRISTHEERIYLGLMPAEDTTLRENPEWSQDVRRYMMLELLRYGPIPSSHFRGLHIGAHVPESMARNILKDLLAEGLAREVKHRGEMRFTWAVPR